ncbi:MAG: dTDP-4-dehydrorhamnose reductase family protein [Candidatus Helarchaeota archaeon]
MKMRVLITGGSGLLGGNLAKIMPNFYDVYGTYYNYKFEMPGIKTFKLDIKNRNEVFKIVKKINPKFIIHCAAITQIIFCEKMPNLSYEINVEGTQNICDAANETKSKIIYISTDHIFDGELGYYAEYDTPNPISTYGKTKYLGEQVIQESGLRYNIIRTFFYGFDIVNNSKYNFICSIINKLKNNRPIKGYRDIFFTPIFVNNLVECIIELSYRNINGVFNLAGSERISHLEFIKKVAKVFGLNENLIKIEEFKKTKWSKLRGPDLSLGIHKALINLKSQLLNIESGLNFMKNLYEKDYVNINKPLIII